jgi:hypothetical protein
VSLSLSLSLTHSLTHTHTHIHTYTHTKHTHTLSLSLTHTHTRITLSHTHVFVMCIANGFRQLSHCVHLSSWRACDWERGPFPPTSVIKKIRHAHYKLKTDRTSSSSPLLYTGCRPARLPSDSELSLTSPSSTPPSISRASRQSSTSPFHTLFTSSFPACRSSVSISSPPPSSSNPTLT